MVPGRARVRPRVEEVARALEPVPRSPTRPHHQCFGKEVGKNRD